MSNPETTQHPAIVQNAAPVLVFKGCGCVSIQCSQYVVLGGPNLDPADPGTQFPNALFAPQTAFQIVRFDAEAEVYAATAQPTGSNSGVRVTRWF